MKEFKYVITDKGGIHARPAGALVKEAAAFPCSITIAKDGKVYSAELPWADCLSIIRRITQ